MERFPKPDSLTEAEVRCLQKSFLTLVPLSDVAADRFFQFVFDCFPAARSQYPHDLVSLGEEIMMELAMVIQSAPHYDYFVGHCNLLLALLVPESVKDVSRQAAAEQMTAAIVSVSDEAFSVQEGNCWEALLEHLVFLSQVPENTQKASVE